MKFAVKYLPYQLYPNAPQEGEDKYSWYRDARFNGDEEHMRKYVVLMTASVSYTHLTLPTKRIV